MDPLRARFALTLVAVVLLTGTSPMPARADDEFSINDVGTVKRGDRDVEFSADVDKPDLVCKFKIKFADGFVLTADKAESDKKGKCKAKVNMPDWRAVVGDATAKLVVQTKKDEERGKASRNFIVRDHRG